MTRGKAARQTGKQTLHQTKAGQVRRTIAQTASVVLASQDRRCNWNRHFSKVTILGCGFFISYVWIFIYSLFMPLHECVLFSESGPIGGLYIILN